MQRVRTAVRPGEPTTLERRDEWAVAFFGTWMIGGLFLDGWSHGVNKPETFFSPWHGVLYSGFAVAVTFIALRSYLERGRGRAFRMEPLMGLGLITFGAAGVGDMMWHQVFGIEVDTAALLSPTHLLLMTGGVLMASAPLRAALRDDDPTRTSNLRTFLPTIASLTLTVALLSFFTMYGSAFTLIAPTSDERMLVHAVMSVLFTNALLLGAMVLVLRRFAPPSGTFTLLFGVVAFAMTGLEGFDQILLVLPALLGGLVADVLASRARLTVSAAVVPAVLWTAFFGVLRVRYDFSMAAELWTGAVFMSVLTGIGLAVLADYVGTSSERATASRSAGLSPSAVS